MKIYKIQTCYFSISAIPIVADREVKLVIHKMDLFSNRYGVRIVR